jgi:hypothetical protein
MNPDLAIHVELPHEFAWSVAARENLGAGLLPDVTHVRLNRAESRPAWRRGSSADP